MSPNAFKEQFLELLAQAQARLGDQDGTEYRRRVDYAAGLVERVLEEWGGNLFAVTVSVGATPHAFAGTEYRRDAAGAFRLWLIGKVRFEQGASTEEPCFDPLCPVPIYIRRFRPCPHVVKQLEAIR